MPDLIPEVLVIGGGPGGAMTAALLAAGGCSVTLLEAHTVLPPRVCGAYLCPAGVTLLEQLGLREVLAADCRPLQGMVLVSPEQRRLVTRFPARGPRHSEGLALRRPAFDEALLRVAADRGAQVCRGVRAVECTRQGAHWLVQTSAGHQVRAHLLVGADGRKSLVARQMKLAAPLRHGRVALHLDVQTREENPPWGEMHVFPDGTYIGLNPVGLRTLNVSAVGDPGRVRSDTVVPFLNARLQSSVHLRSRIAPLAPDAEVRATFPAAASVRRVSWPGFALVGDAAGFIDPLTGEGIYQALWTARALAGEWLGARAAGLAPERALQRYARIRWREHHTKQWLCQGFQSIIRNANLSNRVLRWLAYRPSIADTFIGMVGNVYSPGEALWRMVKAIPST